MNTKAILIGVALIFVTTTSYSGKGDDFKTCYGYFSSGIESKKANKELFVLFDQTISLDNHLKSIVNKKIREFLTPGRKITLVTFSTYEGKRYTKRILTGQLDFPLTPEQEYEIPKREIRKFNSCNKKQNKYALGLLNESLKSALNGTDKAIRNSEIIGNLHRISGSIIKKSMTQNKSVLIVSDMLENSESLSFYKGGKVNLSSGDDALNIVTKGGMLPDLDGAKIYVLGAGFNSKGYKNASTMKKINSFWKKFFKASNSNLIGWGQPELFEKIE